MIRPRQAAPGLVFAAILVVGLLHPATAQAAVALDGRELSIFWSLPFLGVLMCIATGPLLFPHVWEHHYGKIAAGWALLVIAPLAGVFGATTALEAVSTVIALEYLPFIVLLFTLYTIAGGIMVAGDLPGTPRTNITLLAIGGLIASFVGTTGASMILIRPLIRANMARAQKVHVVLFFIFLVSNIGGALTPLGDPPLFVGYLRGVDFFWTTTHLWMETVFAFGILLAMFYAFDSLLYRREPAPVATPATGARVAVRGGANIALLIGVIAAILGTAAWNPGIEVTIPGGHVQLQNLVRDGLLLALAGLSLVITARDIRVANGFNWEPILEVAKLFAAIFVCVVPVIAKLRAGQDGVFAPLIDFVSRPDGSPHNMIYFWVTGLLSAFLDNAPTYLVFFELAGGDPAVLTTTMAGTLKAISLGAVFMGALTYIGNAPNFMVYLVARSMGVPMPSFFGYLAWAAAILVPVLVVTALLFVR